MIGSFGLKTQTVPAATAILNDDGTWECSDPVYQKLINTLFEVNDHKPQDGWFGFKHFYAAVRYFNGTIIYRPVAPASEPGAVY